MKTLIMNTMKRVIKFRVWDDDAEQMIYSDSHEIDTADYWWEIDPLRVGCITGSTGGNNFEPPEPIVTYYDKIMQFTGLLDKNGKEIYEGDILSLEYPIRNVMGDDIDYITIIVTIEYSGGAFWFSGDGYTDCNWHFYNQSDRKIIGNIYETPDLLEL